MPVINVVVDLSHHNGSVDLVKAKTAGILGIIQKATQGDDFVDPTFAANRKKANDAGLLVGAYHFGVGWVAQYGPEGCTGDLEDMDHVAIHQRRARPGAARGGGHRTLRQGQV
jgi:glycosyl hydrolase family 25